MSGPGRRVAPMCFGCLAVAVSDCSSKMIPTHHHKRRELVRQRSAVTVMVNVLKPAAMASHQAQHLLMTKSESLSIGQIHLLSGLCDRDQSRFRVRVVAVAVPRRGTHVRAGDGVAALTAMIIVGLGLRLLPTALDWADGLAVPEFALPCWIHSCERHRVGESFAPIALILKTGFVTSGMQRAGIECRSDPPDLTVFRAGQTGALCFRRSSLSSCGPWLSLQIAFDR